MGANNEAPREMTSKELLDERRHLSAVGLYLGAPLPHPETCRCSKHPDGKGREFNPPKLLPLEPE